MMGSARPRPGGAGHLGPVVIVDVIKYSEEVDVDSARGRHGGVEWRRNVRRV